MGVNVKFQLRKESIKPFFRLKIGTANITCLYDSGAEISTWVADTDLFKDTFPNARELNEVFQISGFGGIGSMTLPAFEIPIFRLGSATFTNLVIAADYNRKFSCDLVLGSNLFKYARIIVDRFNSADLNHPSFIIYQFDKNIYNIKTCHKDGIITKSNILNQSIEQEQLKSASLNIF